ERGGVAFLGQRGELGARGGAELEEAHALPVARDEDRRELLSASQGRDGDLETSILCPGRAGREQAGRRNGSDQETPGAFHGFLLGAHLRAPVWMKQASTPERFLGGKASGSRGRLATMCPLVIAMRVMAGPIDKEFRDRRARFEAETLPWMPA